MICILRVIFFHYLGMAQIKQLKWLVLMQKCNRHAIRANVNKTSKQAKQGECLPCEHHSTLHILLHFCCKVNQNP